MKRKTFFLEGITGFHARLLFQRLLPSLRMAIYQICRKYATYASGYFFFVRNIHKLIGLKSKCFVALNHSIHLYASKISKIPLVLSIHT